MKTRSFGVGSAGFGVRGRRREFGCGPGRIRLLGREVQSMLVSWDISSPVNRSLNLINYGQLVSLFCCRISVFEIDISIFLQQFRISDITAGSIELDDLRVTFNCTSTNRQQYLPDRRLLLVC